MASQTPFSPDKARQLLCRMQDSIRDTLLHSRRKESANFEKIAAVTAADTIYQVDRISEDAIHAWLEKHWPRHWTLELVMEGIDECGPAATFPTGTALKDTRFKCVIDPIDGTRNFMTDKRSAWVLSALAPQKGSRTHTGDILVAAMTELPTTKQWRADQISAVRGGKLHTSAMDVRNGRRLKLELKPSGAKDFKHGFASFSRFFPEGKVLLSQLEEELWEQVHGVGKGRSPLVFDDQYISTGGQLYELLCGHDRMIADLRPLVFRKLGLANELVCHPYDICTALLLEVAGGVVGDEKGRPLKIRLDTTTPVTWVGFANPILAKKVRPLLRKICAKRLAPN